jgi:hypothetical protein
MDKGMESRAELDGDTYRAIVKLRNIHIKIRRIKDEQMGDDIYSWVIHNVQDKPIYSYERYNSSAEAKQHAQLELYLLIQEGK